MHTAYVSITRKHCETGKYSFTTPNYNAKASFHLVPGSELSESRFSGAFHVFLPSCYPRALETGFLSVLVARILSLPEPRYHLTIIIRCPSIKVADCLKTNLLSHCQASVMQLLISPTALPEGALAGAYPLGAHV